MYQREPELAQDRPADPQHDWRAEHKFDPAAWPWPKAKQIMESDHGRHREHHQRDRQSDSDPQPPREISQLGIVGWACACARDRHQSHAANRAIARCIAHDFRVHWADIDGFRRHRARDDGLCMVATRRIPRCLNVGMRVFGPLGVTSLRRANVRGRVCVEFLLATSGAEIMIAPLKHAVACRGSLVDLHATYRISYRSLTSIPYSDVALSALPPRQATFENVYLPNGLKVVSPRLSQSCIPPRYQRILRDG